MLERLNEALSERILAQFLAGDVQNYFADRAAYRFGLEGDKASGNWPPLSEATERIREAKGFTTDEINIRTGELFTFVTEHFELEPGPESVAINLPGHPTNPELEQKVWVAQEGLEEQDWSSFGPTPPRPVIATDSEDMAEVLVLLSKHVIEFMTFGEFGDGQLALGAGGGGGELDLA